MALTVIVALLPLFLADAPVIPAVEPAPAKAVFAAAASEGCELPGGLRAEVLRLFESVAGHASKSGACYDGSGFNAAVEIGRACAEKPEAEVLTVKVRYTFFLREERDTRVCSRNPGGCHLIHERTSHELALTFARSGKAWLLRAPATVPGMETQRGATPLDKVHRGDCYGDIPAFQAQPQQLP